MLQGQPPVRIVPLVQQALRDRPLAVIAMPANVADVHTAQTAVVVVLEAPMRRVNPRLTATIPTLITAQQPKNAIVFAVAPNAMVIQAVIIREVVPMVVHEKDALKTRYVSTDGLICGKWRR